jgi:predicted amino acid racemase
MRNLIFAAVTAALVLGGCSTTKHRYQPTLYGTDPSELAALNRLSVAQPIAVINAQQKDTVVLLGAKGVNELHGSLQDLTETIVMNANRELTKRSIGTNPGSPTALNIRVTAASSDSTVLDVEATLEVEVVTGSGLTKNIKVTNKTPGSVPRAFNGAASLAVIEIFSDPDIFAYLSGS